MNYCEIWLRGVKGFFSWETDKTVFIGSRVVVSFRGRKKIGIVIEISDKKPAFETQIIEEIWDEHFIDERYIQIAREVAEENFTALEKVLGLMIPEKFLEARNPEKREIFYVLNQNLIPGSKNTSDPGIDFLNLKGDKQKLALDILRQSRGRISAKSLRKEISLVTIKGLIQKGVLKEELGQIQTIITSPTKKRENFDLTENQQKAFDEIIKSEKPTLLFGVTGSGKTEIYKKLAAHTLQKDPTAQILFLLPEIALTPQLIAEFHALFGEQIAVWHSHLSEGEKIQEWARLHSGEVNILIGARSSVFVPLKNPKLVILDEEHEWTFKNEFAPRFWTHDVVQKIEHFFCLKLIFGSATPRLESFLLSEKDIWQRVNIPMRIHEVELPSIDLVDMRNEAKKGNFGPVSEKLIFRLQEIFSRKKQAVIFLNKRGFSGSTQCKVCGHTFECPHCTNNMKMHEKLGNRKFLCHVCGHMERFPEKCPECGAENFVFRGWGTQMVEKTLKEIFPTIRIFRADADSVSGKHDFSILMEKFHNHEADILLGTQMIAKGLDFENVELVGIILADVGLNLPDFRSEERVFQILTQVSGRAGRRKMRGEIIIQTFRPEEKIFEFVSRHDSEGFFSWQREMRSQTMMPPFSEMAKITISDVKKEVAFAETKKIYETFKKNIIEGEIASSDLQKEKWECYMAPAFFPRTYGKYHFHVFLRAPQKKPLIDFLATQKINDSAKIDIGPVSLL
ncbi:primosomal protein N' [Candidatus Gracilibacteria bacterium]|nr:primosomal protein N' [Candidatus Gracilibacteria bacterium]